MSEARASTCSCGCGEMTVVTRATEPCSCGCECCDTTAKAPEEEITELLVVRAEIDRKLSELRARVGD